MAVKSASEALEIGIAVILFRMKFKIDLLCWEMRAPTFIPDAPKSFVGPARTCTREESTPSD